MSTVKLLIVGDSATGDIRLAGPVTDMRVMYWLLGEARRLVEREATQREAARSNGPRIVVPNVRTPLRG